MEIIYYLLLPVLFGGGGFRGPKKDPLGGEIQPFNDEYKNDDKNGKQLLNSRGKDGMSSYGGGMSKFGGTLFFHKKLALIRN